MSNETTGGCYAIIPTDVLDDDILSSTEKLLYAMLSSLAVRTGYCYASNAYLAAKMRMSAKSITRLISRIEQRGYIRCEMEATATGQRRRIYAGAFIVTPVRDVRKIVYPLQYR